jgi:hypothetical protein
MPEALYLQYFSVVLVVWGTNRVQGCSGIALLVITSEYFPVREVEYFPTNISTYHVMD